jgi:uncharacterized protein (DUF1800 family)
MALAWHDHFAVSNLALGDTRLILRYYRTLRRHALGSFRELARAITLDPAMWLFLDLAYSTKDAPNENYARELFELFTLGANNGYTEGDIREAARALTGFWWDYEKRIGGYEPTYHDDGDKTIFGQSGRFEPLDVVDLAIANEAHAPFLCAKLWGYLSPRPCPDDLLAAMVAEYRRRGTQLAPVLRLALTHEALYADLEEPDQVKPPLVYVAGLLRSTGQGVSRPEWSWLLWTMGQAPFYPPNVSGWPTGPAWLSTATIQARYQAAALALAGIDPAGDGTQGDDLASAFSVTGWPWISASAAEALTAFASSTTALRPQRQRLLVHALLGGPDAQVC